MRLGAKRIPWTEAEDAVVRERYGYLPAAEVGRLIGRSEPAIWHRAKALGLDKRRERHDSWAEAELDEVRRYYSIECPSVIAKRLGRTTSAVSQQAAVLGVVSNKALIAAATVHGYFSEITTAEQAYILGLMAADGNISEPHPRIIFGLQASDAHLVEWVRDRLNPKASIYRTRDGFAKIQITSSRMVSDLARYGVVPRKSLTLQWPSGLGPLLRPYLTGHFDGDGWIYTIRGDCPGWGTGSGSRQFLADMKEYILAETGVAMWKIQKRRGAELYQMAKTGSSALVLDEWLHLDGYGLARKRFPVWMRHGYYASPQG